MIPGNGSSPGEGIGYPLQYFWASLVAQTIKNPPAMWETWVWSLGWEDPLEGGKETHFSILAWSIPMDSRTWWVTLHGLTESDATEWLNTTQHISSKLPINRKTCYHFLKCRCISDYLGIFLKNTNAWYSFFFSLPKLQICFKWTDMFKNNWTIWESFTFISFVSVFLVYIQCSHFIWFMFSSFSISFL